MRLQHLLFLLLAAGCPAIPARANLADGLVAWWRMDETSGLIAHDSTTNLHDAVLTNFPAGNAQWLAGFTNGGLNFNGTTNNQRAVIDDSAGKLNFGARPNPAFSLALWVKGLPGAQSPGSGVMAKGSGRGKEQFVIDTYANAFRFFVRSSAGVSFLAAGPLVDGAWTHLVGTYDGVNTNNGLRLYVNGELYSSVNAPATLTNTTHEISLGMREDNASSGYNLPFYGILDDVRIYDRMLTAADVQELCPVQVIPDAEFTTLRLLWRDMLNGGTNLNPADPDVISRLTSLSASAQSYWSSLDQSPSRQFLWQDLPNLTNDSGHLWFTYDRLKTLALAYTTPGGSLCGNSALRDDLVSALDWMYANIYNENKAQTGNWWHYQIGVPLRLNDITVLLYDTLTGTQITNYMNAVNKFTPAPVGTAANLVWEATVVAVRGVIVKNSGKIASAATSLSSVFPYVTSGDGFYRDGSFIQHSYYPYTGSYGSSLIVFLAPILRMLDGSRWEVTDPQMTNVFQWAHSAYQPVIYKGAIMDMCAGGPYRARARPIALSGTRPSPRLSGWRSLPRRPTPRRTNP